jgi:hypothetical protein
LIDVLKRQNTARALGFVGIRILEAAAIVSGVVIVMTMVTSPEARAGPDALATGDALVAMQPCGVPGGWPYAAYRWLDGSSRNRWSLTSPIRSSRLPRLTKPNTEVSSPARRSACRPVRLSRSDVHASG